MPDRQPTAARSDYVNDIVRDGQELAYPDLIGTGVDEGVYVGVFSGVRTRLAGSVLTDYRAVAEGEVVQFCNQRRADLDREGKSSVNTVYLRHGVFPTEVVQSLRYNPAAQQYAGRIRYGGCDTQPLVSQVLCSFPRPSWEGPRVEADLWQPHMECDVFAMQEYNPARLERVTSLLDKLAGETNDCPVPKYQNIVDPNLFVRKGEWVASEWDISHDGKASIVGRGPGEELAHVHSRVVDGVFTPILQLALPVLAKKLQRPALHLPGRRLQAVPKAQRIIVPPKGVLLEGEEGSGGAYEGLWHSDGDVEDIVAVVVYYYNVDAALEGGAMEFASRDMHDMLAWADCGDNGMDFSHKLLTEHRKGDTASSRLPVYSVPVETGTILVFSNYQMIHRVLRMVNTSDQPASRDFALLFIVNPDAKLPSARDHLVSPEYMSETDEERRMRRLTKLHAQLSPNSCFGCDEKVYATGNGCAMIMRWVKELIEYSSLTDWKLEQRGGGTAYTSITLPPTQVNRGMSERLSDTSSKTDAAVRHFLATGINDPSPTAAHTTTF